MAKKKTSKRGRKLKILGVCGGNGVVLHPFRRHVIGNIEDRGVFKTEKNMQWYMNFKVPFVDDLQVAKYLFKDPDIIIGAPDCGHSSILGFTGNKKRKNPIENASIKMFFQSILDYKPKVWIMENLPALLNSISMLDFKENFPNYRFIFHTISMAELGNSQKTRKRLIVVALDRSLPADLFMAFSDIDRQNEPKTVKHVLAGLEEDIPEIGNIRESPDKKIKMGNKKMTFGEIEEGWNTIYKNQRYWPLDDKKEDSAYIPGVYRLTPNKFPQTCRQDPRQFRPDGKPLSPRELARIQGIPDSYKLFIPLDDDKGTEYYINKARITIAKGAPYELGLWLRSKIKLCREYL